MRSRYETRVRPALDRIRRWAGEGRSLREIAGELGVSPAALRRYRAERPELAACFPGEPPPPGPAGDEAASDAVEAALLRRACGYDYEEQVTEEKYVKEMGEVVTFTRTSRKHLQPDSTAIQFWLTNRRKDRWAQRPEPERPEAAEETGVVILPELVSVEETPAGREREDG